MFSWCRMERNPCQRLRQPRPHARQCQCATERLHVTIPPKRVAFCHPTIARTRRDAHLAIPACIVSARCRNRTFATLITDTAAEGSDVVRRHRQLCATLEHHLECVTVAVHRHRQAGRVLAATCITVHPELLFLRTRSASAYAWQIGSMLTCRPERRSQVLCSPPAHLKDARAHASQPRF